MATKYSEFDKMIGVRCPATMMDAVQRAAAREQQTIAAYVRSIVVQRLRADGYDLSENRREVAA